MKLKTYFSFAILSFLFLISGFFLGDKSTLDINVHDTYYVIVYSHLYWLISWCLFVVFTIYLVLDKAKIELNLLFRIHVFGTIVSLIGLTFPYEFIFKPSHFPLFDDFLYVNLCLSISALLFLLFQILFIINIFVSIIKKLCKTASL